MPLINHTEAEKLLNQVIAEVKSGKFVPKSPSSELIKAIISGTHLTYRYILVNALLAKSTNSEINPLALQAGSSLSGAYDARSLCHKVLVKIERESLNGSLGASNEPFLNKPARFPELSLKNAVRRGSDEQTLKHLIKVLSSTEGDNNLTRQMLKESIFFALERTNREIAGLIVQEEGMLNEKEGSILNFVETFLQKSFEGESSALIAGAAFSILQKIKNSPLDVIVHPVNQSGSSSNEISDIDVYSNKALIYSAEVKDKPFTAQDVEHAAKKVKAGGHNCLLFLIGPRGKDMDGSIKNSSELWRNTNVKVIFLNVFAFFQHMYALYDALTYQELLDFLMYYSKTARIKDQTTKHLIESAKKQGWEYELKEKK